MSLHFKLAPVLKNECGLLTIYFHFPVHVGGRPLMPPKKNQISSPLHPLPCERKVLFSETSECQSCWKLSSWHSNKTRLECGYCCGDAKGKSFYDCLTFICSSLPPLSATAACMYSRCILYLIEHAIWTWVATWICTCSSGWLGTFCRFIPEFLPSHCDLQGGNEWYCN